MDLDNDLLPSYIIDPCHRINRSTVLYHSLAFGYSKVQFRKSSTYQHTLYHSTELYRNLHRKPLITCSQPWQVWQWLEGSVNLPTNHWLNTNHHDLATKYYKLSNNNLSRQNGWPMASTSTQGYATVTNSPMTAHIKPTMNPPAELLHKSSLFSTKNQTKVKKRI